MGMKKRFFILFCAVFVLASASYVGADVRGSSDHPIISRYPESRIMYYVQRDYDEYRLLVEKKEGDEEFGVINLEGKVTQITYRAPEERSTLEIFRNYESALKQAGFTFITQGAKSDFGSEWLRSFARAASRAPKDTIGADLGARLNRADYRYLAAKQKRAQGDVYVSVCAALGWFQKFPIVQVDIIEEKAMDIGLIKADADALEREIERTGTAPVYDIYFDRGKADVKPESEDAFRETAKLLKKNPDMKLYIAGHTDNTGSFDFNMELSKARAAAVVKKLVSDYNIDNDRLYPVGVGPVSPVLSNRTPEGRAKNRRVELVER